MLVYEVEITVDPSILEEYESWLPGHLHEMMSINGFEDFQYFKQTINLDCNEKTDNVFVVHFYMKDVESLNRYINSSALQFRKNSAEKFDHKFTAKRRSLEIQNK